MRLDLLAIALLVALSLLPSSAAATHDAPFCPLQDTFQTSPCTDDDPFGAGIGRWWAYLYRGVFVTNPTGFCWLVGPGGISCYDCAETWNCDETSAVEWALQCGRDDPGWQLVREHVCGAYRLVTSVPGHVRTTVGPT